jgi:putative phosphoesterase
VQRTRTAIELLQKAGATEFIHCGDVEEDSVLDTLAGLQAHVVLGNCDRAGPLARYGTRIGLDMQHPSGRITVDGKRIAFTHGDQTDLLQAAIAERVDFLCHGHTHLRRDDMVQGVRVINPGALHRANPFTVALLTPATGALQFITVT